MADNIYKTQKLGQNFLEPEKHIITWHSFSNSPEKNKAIANILFQKKVKSNLDKQISKQDRCPRMTILYKQTQIS